MRLLSLLRRRRILPAHYTRLCTDSPEVIPKEPCKTWKPHSTDVGGRTGAWDGPGIPESSVLPEFIHHRLRCFETLRERYEARLADKVLRESHPIRISLPEGKVVSGESWRTSAYDVAVQTRSSSVHNILAARVNGVVFDLMRPLEDDSEIDFLNFDSREGQDVFWHSSAHVLGAALEQIYGGLLCHGPSIENGFFYDIHLENRTVLGSDLPGLEIACKEIIRRKLPFQRVEATREDLLEMFKYNKFKTQIIEDKVETTTSIYRCGSLVDLCQGPHVRHTGQIKTIKLHKNSTAYWKGDAAQEKLQRVYGISFPDTKQLKEWDKAQEEAANRDHRKIGRDQGLFFFHEMSPGSCFFLPKGAHIYNVLIDFIKDEYRKRGFTEVITPNMYNNKLWEQSGHWEHYGKNMFSFPVENETFSLKPMNCPGHCLMFDHRPRSWRELPVRLADFGVLHRNELSGALSGLTRVRRFQQDDAHIFCSIDQLEGEISGCLDFLRAVYTVFGFTFKLFLSTRPEQYMGEEEVWQKAEQELENSLNGFGLPWELNPGDGAFYGPKIDIQIKDAMGRYHQCATIQLDFQLPIRFQLSYVGKDGRTERPVMIHRAVLGSVERMLAVLAENYAGKWPFWLSPFQVMVVPTGASAEDYTQEVYRTIHDRGFMVDIDTDPGTTFNKKIRRAQLAQYNFILEDEIDDYDMFQREIVPQFQVEQSEIQLPFLIQGEPELSPRGRRPISPCGGREPCPLDGLTDPFGSNLNTFPPGRPTHDNIGNICLRSRPKTQYGRLNLPQTGYSHLSRQGNAINELEEGFTRCCRQSDKLQCAVGVWKKTLDDFCWTEFSVKTRPYHCCKQSGAQRETCFNDGASNPSYITTAALQTINSEDAAPVGASRRSFKACPSGSPKCQENMDSQYKLSDLAFPPGEPKSSNIQNICKLRKYRPQYTDSLLPSSGYGHYMRRAKAIQRMEGEFKKCCKTEDVACAHNGWKKVLGKFCAKEQLVKTKHHECCKKRDQASMYSCFASEAPFPEYDREVEVLDLGNITEDGLQKLCGETKLLTKQKQMPLLVSGLKKTCCSLPQDETLRCAAEQKEKFIKTLCGSKKALWKDTQACCSKNDQEREQCFTYYLQSISMAVSHRTKGE